MHRAPAWSVNLDGLQSRIRVSGSSASVRGAREPLITGISYRALLRLTLRGGSLEYVRDDLPFNESTVPLIKQPNVQLQGWRSEAERSREKGISLDAYHKSAVGANGTNLQVNSNEGIG